MALLNRWRRRPLPPAPPLLRFPEIDELQEALDTLRQVGSGQELDEPLAELAVHLWAIARVLSRRADGVPTRQDAELAARRAQAGLDHLRERFNVSVPSLDGRLYVNGMQLDVIDKREEAALSEPTIIETAAPLVMRAGRRLRRPTVIVGYPPKGAESRGP